MLLWPAILCELMAVETDGYAFQKGTLSWQSVGLSEIWTFMGITILMGIKRLSRISNYWSRDSFIGVPNLGQYMSQARFWALWRNLHLLDNENVPASGGLSRKIQPMLDTLSRTFLECYSPGQELSVAEAMVNTRNV